MTDTDHLLATAPNSCFHHRGFDQHSFKLHVLNLLQDTGKVHLVVGIEIGLSSDFEESFLEDSPFTLGFIRSA